MNKKKFLTVALTVMIASGLIIAGAYAYRQTGSQRQNKNNEELIGGEKDAHGCLAAAGYSWCEAKGKCLKIWEEACAENSDTSAAQPSEADTAGIKQAFIDKYKKNAGDIQVQINQFDGSFARGGVKFAPVGQPGEGGLFLSYKENSEWKLAFDGNGMYSCSAMRELDFPDEMIPDCADGQPGALDSAQLPNPASVYCKEQNGMLEINTDDNGGQSGICKFTDGSECDEWAFFRGECGQEQ